MKLKNVIWGLFFIAAAAVIIIHQMGVFGDGIGLWNVILTILMIPVIVKSIMHLNFFGIFFPIALGIIIYQQPLGLEAITPWPVLIAALFFSIGLSMIVRRSSLPCAGRFHKDHFSERVESHDESELEFTESFGASSKYLNSSSLKKANFRCSFGALKIYFDNAELDPEGAEISLDCSFCGVEMYIPKTWRVENNINVALGGVDEKNKAFGGDGPTLRLSGSISLSGVEIIYVSEIASAS